MTHKPDHPPETIIEEIPEGLPELVRVYIRQVAIGVAIAVLFTALLIGLNVAGLRHLVMSVSGGWVAVFMLTFFNAIVFGGVQFAITIMSMAEPPEGRGGGLRQHLARAFSSLSHRNAVPVRATAAAKPRRRR